MNKTLVIIKPDTFENKNVWNVINIFEREWYLIKEMKLFKNNKNLLNHHYNVIWKLEERLWKEISNRVIDFMMESPLIVMILENKKSNTVVDDVRELVWKTEPIAAKQWTIRNLFSKDSYELSWLEKRWIRNVIHASANDEEALAEMKLWFPSYEREWVLFWVFDIVHLWHIYLIEESLDKVDKLNIVLMDDWKVKEKKNRKVLFNIKIREKILKEKLKEYKFVELSNKTINIVRWTDDSLDDLVKINPDIVFLGYDQNFEHKIKDLGYKYEKIKEYHPEKYKSTKIREKIKEKKR